MSDSGSQVSARPPPKPKVLNPIDSRATLPARIIRSAQEIFRPYFCLIGHNSRRALSRFTLSGQLLRGAKRRHQGMQVLDYRVEVEALEFLGIVECLAHRIGQGGVLMENLNIQLARPP